MASEKRFEAVIKRIFSGGKVVEVRPLTGGMSARVVGVNVDEDGVVERVVVRWYEGWEEAAAVGVLEKEFLVLEVAREAGIRVARPILWAPDGSGFGRPYSVVEFVAGEMVFAPADLDRYIDQYATQLARIHQVDTEGAELEFLPQKRPYCAEVERWPEMVNDNLIEGEIREVLASTRIEPSRNKRVLVHGDFWPGNVLWRGGELAAVIDWEDAAVGEPLLDFAQSRSEVAWIFGQEGLERFTARYQALVDVDYGMLPYWDLCAALRFVRLLGGDLGETAAFFHQYGREDITAESIYADYLAFVGQALSQIG